MICGAENGSGIARNRITMPIPATLCPLNYLVLKIHSCMAYVFCCADSRSNCMAFKKFTTSLRDVLRNLADFWCKKRHAATIMPICLPLGKDDCARFQFVNLVPLLCFCKAGCPPLPFTFNMHTVQCSSSFVYILKPQVQCADTNKTANKILLSYI
jgi:hypothetical protein